MKSEKVKVWRGEKKYSHISDFEVELLKLERLLDSLHQMNPTEKKIGRCLGICRSILGKLGWKEKAKSLNESLHELCPNLVLDTLANTIVADQTKCITCEEKCPLSEKWVRLDDVKEKRMNENLIQKYQRTKSLAKRRPLLSQIVREFGRDKAAAVCKLEDVEWLHWYFWEMPKLIEKREKESIEGYLEKEEEK
jgi:hypothetical protein